MTIRPPKDVEAAVRSGRFSSVDEAMSEAARMLPRTIARAEPEASADLLLGLMRNDVELMDEIVEETYRRREEVWRDVDLHVLTWMDPGIVSEISHDQA